ncbi:uncharacterized protein LOC124439642 [Xenia sp. Carnegie-2017]|uniref:uncharacterized protein LOC124439642 n=1 Tax=Xenia sp. Carnegie-2017 TaxID=2897299 RepID=UPI001F0504F1|nr:uncharacterized protein LOC124439642 [Xenia sp. Carnegie-2017]
MAIDTIIFPLNTSGSHWTLLVIDKQKEMVYYLDPMEGHVEEVISEATRVELSQFIKSIWRNSLVCKICKIDDGEDWLGCDSCGQYFHASCLNVDLGQTLTEYFACP